MAGVEPVGVPVGVSAVATRSLSAIDTEHAAELDVAVLEIVTVQAVSAPLTRNVKARLLPAPGAAFNTTAIFVTVMLSAMLWVLISVVLPALVPPDSG